MPRHSTAHSTNPSRQSGQRPEALQTQLVTLELQISELKYSLVGYERKKDFAGTLFLAGSALLALILISAPTLAAFASIVLMVYGVAEYLRGRSDSRDAQQRIAAIDLEISTIKARPHTSSRAACS